MEKKGGKGEERRGRVGQGEEGKVEQEGKKKAEEKDQEKKKRKTPLHEEKAKDMVEKREEEGEEGDWYKRGLNGIHHGGGAQEKEPCISILSLERQHSPKKPN